MIKAFLHQQPHASKTDMEESRFNSNWCSMSSGNKRSYLFKQVHSFSSRLFRVCMPSITTTIKGLEFIPWQVYITLILPLNLSTLYADLEVLLTNPILITIFWFLLWARGHQEPCNEVGSLSPTLHLWGLTWNPPNTIAML